MFCFYKFWLLVSAPCRSTTRRVWLQPSTFTQWVLRFLSVKTINRKLLFHVLDEWAMKCVWFKSNSISSFFTLLYYWSVYSLTITFIHHLWVALNTFLDVSRHHWHGTCYSFIYLFSSGGQLCYRSRRRLGYLHRLLQVRPPVCTNITKFNGNYYIWNYSRLNDLNFYRRRCTKCF